MKKYSLFFIIYLLQACASQAPPPGGPEDKTPPLVISSSPEVNSLNVDPNQTVEILFSEKIDPRSVPNAVFISPNPGKSVEIKVKGKKIILNFDKPLIENVTYTITLGTGIKDLRANSLLQSFTLAFSTGEKLDRNEIHGKVFYEKPEEVTVWAYFLENEEVNPSIRQPDYITQCGADGAFAFHNIAPRIYRLFAVVDRNRNQTFQINQEMVGVASSDVDLSADSLIVKNKYFRLTKIDTSRIRILQVEQSDRRHLRVRLSRPINQPENTSFTAELRDSLNRKLTISDIVSRDDQSDIWSLTTEPRREGKCTIILQNLYDQHRKKIAGSIRTDFRSISRTDTSRPEIVSVVPADSSRHVALNSPVIFNFSESIDTTLARNLATLYQDSVETGEYTISWKSLSQLILKPDSLWSPRSWYTCELDTSRMVDLAGNPLRFKKYTYSWKILNPDTLSEISGRIVDEDSGATGQIIVELMKNGQPEAYRHIFLPDTGAYKFSDILPGRYFVQGFRDSDNNGIYSFGNVLPFIPAERFFVAEDTILVRSRWPNEGNNYRLLK